MRSQKYLIVPVNDKYSFTIFSSSIRLCWFIYNSPLSSVCHQIRSVTLCAISSQACINGSEWHFVEFVLLPGAKLDKMLLKSARNDKVILIVFLGSIYSDRFTDTSFG